MGTAIQFSNMDANIKQTASLTLILCLVFSLLFMGGCSPKTDAPQEQEGFENDLQAEVHASDYKNSKQGLSFDYLDSWSLKEEEKGDALYLTLTFREEGETSDSARIIISVITGETLSPERVVQDLMNTLGEVDVLADGPSKIQQYDAHLFEALTRSPETLRVKNYIMQEKKGTFIYTYMAREDKAETLEQGFTKILSTLDLN